MKERIKMLRKHMGLTQAAFGQRLGLRANTITGYETGVRVPSDHIIIAICREFGVNEDWLRTGAGGDGAMFAPGKQSDIAAIVEKYGLPKEVYTLLLEFIQLPERSQYAIIDYIRRIAAGLSEDGADVITAVLNTHDWSDDDLHDELQRQIDEEREARKKGTGS